MKTLDMSRFRPFRPLGIRSCVLRGYTDYHALVIADRAERGFVDMYPHEREIASAQG